jgi:hypothetical protein
MAVKINHLLYWLLPYLATFQAQTWLYAAINAGFGGILISSNFAASMWASLLSNDQPTTGTAINAI